MPEDPNFSYVRLGQYASQLRHWFDVVVGRERILVLGDC
jgi:hypothetical protein